MALLSKKDLITRIILQDLKHNQLIKPLRDIGLDDSDVFSLDLLSIVAELLEIPEEKVSEQWIGVYNDLMDRSTNFPVSHVGKELRPLAEEGYEMLEICLKIEGVA
jgi:hypothetical protein